ncbi:unnamed protein product [Urochloa humidicola]
MAPAPAPALAPGDRAGGDAAPEPPDHAPTQTTASPPPAAHPHRSTAPRPAPPSSSPAPQARPRLKARRGGGATPRSRQHATQGEAVQEKLLLDFHATAVPGAIAPTPNPMPLWATPTSRSRRFNLAFVRNMLNNTLTTRPSRLEV